MLKLNENETVAVVVRKHWFVMTRTVVLFAFLLFLPLLASLLLPFAKTFFDQTALDAIVHFILALYAMGILLFLFLAWMDYYLDMWIVTNMRIIDIKQNGLFNREISEIPMNRIQDVTIEVKGVVETMLKFGAIRIRTAGDQEFTITNIPRLYEVKDAILKYASSEIQPRPDRAIR